MKNKIFSIAIAFVLLLSSPITAYGAIAFVDSVAENCPSSTECTFSFDNVDGTVLVCGATIFDTADKISGITYDGVAMTLADGESNAPAGTYIEMYSLDAPSTGANNVVITTSETESPQVRCSSYSGAGGVDTYVSNPSNNTTLMSTDITTTLDNDWLVQFWSDSSCDGSDTFSGTIRETGSCAYLGDDSSPTIPDTYTTDLGKASATYFVTVLMAIYESDAPPPTPTTTVSTTTVSADKTTDVLFHGFIIFFICLWFWIWFFEVTDKKR